VIFVVWFLTTALYAVPIVWGARQGERIKIAHDFRPILTGWLTKCRFFGIEMSKKPLFSRDFDAFALGREAID
jgi:hypothetical protein